MTTDVKRGYDGSGRQARAQETRRAVLRAAHELFVARGYGRTTIADVARAADVSVETVYGAFRNKATLLHRVWDVTIGGDDADVVYHERPEIRAMRDEPDLARRLAMQARVFTGTARRVVPFLLALQGAAASEPTAAMLLEEIGGQRLRGIGVMAAEAAKTGQLAVSEDECRDVIWAFTDGMLWHRLVQQRGWTDEAFAVWLEQMWVAVLVRP
ncbi:MAG: regulatory protein TetR [Frankiales bacterium]|nr:regulatory protein TetR [Frankiales bacterium]